MRTSCSAHTGDWQSLTIPGGDEGANRANMVVGPEGAKQKSPGREPWEKWERKAEPCKGETAVTPLQGSAHFDCIPQGSGRLRRRLRPGLCCLVLSGPLPGCGALAAHHDRFERFTKQASALPEDLTWTNLMLWLLPRPVFEEFWRTLGSPDPIQRRGFRCRTQGSMPWGLLHGLFRARCLGLNQSQTHP